MQLCKSGGADVETRRKLAAELGADVNGGDDDGVAPWLPFLVK